MKKTNIVNLLFAIFGIGSLWITTPALSAKSVNQNSHNHSVVLSSQSSYKKLNVVTSTMNLYSLTQVVAGELAHLESLIKGPQDPHFVPAKPSLMLKARKADLLIFIGMDLEVGWLPLIIKGAKNPLIQKGKKGHLDVSQFIQALSVPEGKVDRFFGDIHPFGNPHILLDPERAVQVSQKISQQLSVLDPRHSSNYEKNHNLFEANIKKQIKKWKERIKKSGIKKIVTYHSSFEYFLDQFSIELLGLIEEKPGIPPSIKHILSLTEKIKAERGICVLISSFYSKKWAKKIKAQAPIHVETVAIEVMALKEAPDYIHLIDGIVKAIENCGKVISTLTS